MEGVSGALVFLAVAACCGLPILLLGTLQEEDSLRIQQDVEFNRPSPLRHYYVSLPPN